jgi:exopolysaccharide biosynthesis polyprenyl glycosylphosphotransferase
MNPFTILLAKTAGSRQTESVFGSASAQPTLGRAHPASATAERRPADRLPNRPDVASDAASTDDRADGGSIWTSAWCKPVDTTIAVVTLLSIVAVAAGVRPSGLAEFLALRVTLKNALLLSMFVVLWPMALTTAGAYDGGRMSSLRVTVARLVAGCAMGSVLVLAVQLTSSTGLLGITTIPILWASTVLGTLAVRLGVRLAVHIKWERSVLHRVVIVGTGPRAASLWLYLRRHPLVRYELIAVCDVPETTPAPVFSEYPLVMLDGLEDYCMRAVVDEVFVALPVRSRYEEIQRALRICEHGGVHATYLDDAFSSKIARPRRRASGRFAVVSMHVVQDDWRLYLKRLIDVVVAAVALVLLAPLLVAIAVLVKATSPGPVIFPQERFGLRKRRFRMFKFRTMVPDAERLIINLESQNEATGAAFKMRNDPRVTSFGRLLRRTSLDELPQFWNVLMGDMTLVGPRPMSVRDVSRFDEAWLMRRFSVRPGLTCLWQVGGRSNLTFEQWMELDLTYIDQWSLGLDMKILAQTVPAVLRGVGAA